MPEPTMPPAADPEQLEQALGRLRMMNDQLGLFHTARRIVENPALLSSKAIEQLRALYADYDAKHPGAGQ